MTVLRGTLVSFDSPTFRATVRLDGSPSQSLAGLPVSRGLPAPEMVPGRRVLLEQGQPHNPGEMVVVAVW